MPDRFTGREQTHTGYTARHERLLRRHATPPATSGGFDPNEDPVIIGANATADTATPSAPSGGPAGAVAVGKFAAAGSAVSGIAVGSSATVHDVDNGIAIGVSAQVYAADGVAIGVGAEADYVSSVALGPHAGTTADRQIMLGKSSSGSGAFTELGRYDSTYGSILVMASPNGTRYALQVDDSGVLSVVASPV